MRRRWHRPSVLDSSRPPATLVTEVETYSNYIDVVKGPRPIFRRARKKQRIGIAAVRAGASTVLIDRIRSQRGTTARSRYVIGGQ
jgi:hypothetical protein